MTGFGEVASLALISGSTELLRAWIAETLGALADDDEHNSRLRDTLRLLSLSPSPCWTGRPSRKLRPARAALPPR